MSRANEQAFPVPAVAGLPNDNVVWGSNGLTIREHFAAMAMQGLTACHGTAGLNRGVGDTAERAVQMADVLIAELAKPAVNELAPMVKEARELVTNFIAMVKTVPEFNHHKYDSFGIRAHNFLDAAAKVTP